MTEDDDRLMLGVRAGSHVAFETLFARYADAVWRFFRRRVPDAGRAEELAQDTFVALLESAGRYQSRARFRSYLFGIAYNVLLADHRKSRNAPVPLVDEHLLPAPGADPDGAMWVRNALATLDADDREILMLREYEQLSYEEIAAVRATPLNTVRSQLFRARMALKSALESEVRNTHERR